MARTAREMRPLIRKSTCINLLCILLQPNDSRKVAVSHKRWAFFWVSLQLPPQSSAPHTVLLLMANRSVSVLVAIGALQLHSAHMMALRVAYFYHSIEQH